MRERKTLEGESPAPEADSEDSTQRLRQLATRRRSVQRKATGAARPTKIPAGGGEPLAEGVRRKMEAHLGADLSAVQVHTGAESAQAATSLSARAFTVGKDVHFNAGEFAPESKAGQKLLAHELTHVVQGNSSGVHRQVEEEAEEEETDSGGDEIGAALEAAAEAGDKAEGEEAMEVSSPGDPSEREADTVADSLDGGEAAEGAITEAAPEIGRKSEVDPIKLQSPKKAPKKKQNDLEKKKQELLKLLGSIKTPADLPQLEPQLQAFEKQDPVLAEMVRAFREKLGAKPMPPRDVKIPPLGPIVESEVPPGARPESPLAPKPPKKEESPLDKLTKGPKPPPENAHPARPNNAPDAPVNPRDQKNISTPGIPYDAPAKEKSDAVPLKKGEAEKKASPTAEPKKPEEKKPPGEKKKELGLFEKVGKALQAINDLITPKHREEPEEEEAHGHQPSESERLAENLAFVGKAYDTVAPRLKLPAWNDLSEKQRSAGCDAFHGGPDAFHYWMLDLVDHFRPLEEGAPMPEGGKPDRA